MLSEPVHCRMDEQATLQKASQCLELSRGYAGHGEEASPVLSPEKQVWPQTELAEEWTLLVTQQITIILLLSSFHPSGINRRAPWGPFTCLAEQAQGPEQEWGISGGSAVFAQTQVSVHQEATPTLRGLKTPQARKEAGPRGRGIDGGRARGKGAGGGGALG